MPRSADPLFTPYTLNGLTLPNRFAMAPMTRWKSPGGYPGEEVAAYYRRRAEGGVGLIITEGTTVDHPVSSQHADTPSFFGEALKGWKRVVDEVHDAGGLIFPQLWHVGLTRPRQPLAPNPELPGVGPSGYLKPGKRITEAMSRADIKAVTDAFGQAAYAARELGFDGVEVHGAHGYLIDQFFWADVNERDDEYGGALEQRARFGVEVIESIRRAVGPDYPFIFRWSQWKQQDYAVKMATTPEALGKFLKPLADAGVDMFHASQRRFWEPEFEGSDLNLAGWTKQLTGKPVMTVGSVGLTGEFLADLYEGGASAPASLDALIDRFEAGEFDLVAVGRLLIADPHWTNKVKEGRWTDLVPFTKAALEGLY